MTALRQRFIEDLQLHGFAASTPQVYVSAIKLLARHYGQAPDRLTEEQIRQYFLFLTHERKVSRSNATITLCTIKFLYEHTLQRPWPVFRVARPRREHKIPAVMSREEEAGYKPATSLGAWRGSCGAFLVIQFRCRC